MNQGMPEGDTAGGRATINLRLWALVISFPPLAYLFIDLLNYREQASGWFAVRVMVAQVMLEGKKLYLDVFDLTQPILLELLKLTLIPAKVLQYCFNPLTDLIGLQFSFAPDLFATFAVFLCLCWSLYLTVSVAKSALATADSDTKLEVRNTILPCLLGASIASLIVRFDFGDLQHLFTMALLPWIYMRWLRYRGVDFPRRLALTVGIVTGIAVCFDFPYILVIALLEVSFMLLEQRLKPPLKIELAAVAAILPIYLCIVSLPDHYRQRYWEVVMPIRWLTFLQENMLVFGPHSSTKRLDVIYSMCVVIVASLLFTKGKTLETLFAILALMGFGLYVLGGDGLSHDMIVLIFANSIATMLIFAEIAKRASAVDLAKVKFKELWKVVKGIRRLNPETVLLAASMAFTVLVAIGFHQNRAMLASVVVAEKEWTKYTFEQALEKLSAPKETVSIFYDTPLAFPCMLVLDRRPADYLLYCRPLLTLDWAKKRNYITEPLSKFRQEVFVRIHIGIDLSRPDLILVCDDYCRDFITEENIWPRLEQNYDIVANCRFNSGRWPPREYVGFNWNMNAFRRRPAQLP